MAVEVGFYIEKSNSLHFNSTTDRVIIDLVTGHCQRLAPKFWIHTGFGA